MVLNNFSDLLKLQNNSSDKKKLVLVCAEDKQSIEAVLNEKLNELVHPILIGDSSKIIQLLAETNRSAEGVEVIHTDTVTEAAEKGVELVKEGNADLIMKGHLQTREFLQPIVNKEKGIVSDNLLTHVVLNQVPQYTKLLLTTDGGMVPEPSLDQKIVITKNAINVMNRLGYKKPKIALLAATEVVNPKIESSRDAEEIMEYFKKNYPNDCEIDGPLSLDLSLSKEIAHTKHYESPVAGDADILVGPDMTAMNILGKSLVVLGQGKIAGIVCGAKVPIVMTSRGSSTEEKYLSIVLACLTSGGTTI